VSRPYKHVFTRRSRPPRGLIGILEGSWMADHAWAAIALRLVLAVFVVCGLLAAGSLQSGAGIIETITTAGPPV
jgi:hypothetical protein